MARISTTILTIRKYHLAVLAPHDWHRSAVSNVRCLHFLQRCIFTADIVRLPHRAVNGQ